MKKITRNIATLMVLTVAGTTVATAQVVEQKVGDNNLIMNQNAVLEIESTNRGLLLPRLELTATDNFAPLTAHVEGMTIYNTATAGTGETAVTPGYYYNDGAKWVRVATGADAKNEPWFIQNTSDEATANDDNIYQQGKVAIGFTDADGVSEKQLDVKGDFKTEANVGGRNVGFDSNFGGSGIGIWYNADDLENPTDMGVIQLHQNSVHLVAQSPTNIGATQIAPGTVESRAGNWGLTDGVSIHHMDQAQIFLSSGSGSGGSVDLTSLYVRKGQGILFSHRDDNGDAMGQYTFPRNAGTVGQVLGVDTFTPGNSHSTLSWQNVSDLVDLKEPWKIQNTDNEATANTDDIYQHGKVAVGFTDADAVSDKQLDVKGDFRTLTEVGGRYTGIETNFAGAEGFTVIFNSDDIDNLTDATNFYVGQDMVGSTAKTSNKRAASMLTPSIIEHSVGTMDLTNMVSNFSMTESSIVLKTQEGGAVDNINRTSLMLGNGTNDIKFVYSDGSGNLTGAYTFPKTAGNVGQVLGVATRIGNTSTLEWQDAAEAAAEPWKIQNTTNDATANDDDIYQQGKVAIGFTDADGISDKQLEVKGDVKTEFVDTDGYVYGFQTNMTNGSQKENLMYISDNADLSAATHTSYLGVNKSTVAFMNIDKTTAIEKSNAIMASAVGDGGVVGVISETSDGRRAGIGGATWGSAVETTMDASQDNVDMKISIRPEIGIAFHHDNDGGGFGSYTFPQSAPTEGQVLSASATSNTYGGRQLEWKTPASALTEPWQVQGTTNEATANTENIFQLGSVAIGANTIPSITTGSGTVNPTLHVAGDVSTTGKFYTTSSVYADYVFEKYFDGKSEINNKYEFKSLDYIKEFVEKNKHLPGVTKIEDLLKGENGYMFDMTELSIQQLEKIEELFLHVIEQNEQIIELEKQVEDNNNRLDALEKLLLDNSK